MKALHNFLSHKIILKIIVFNLVVMSTMGYFYYQEKHPPLSADPISQNSDYQIQIKSDSPDRKELWVWDKRPEFGIGVHNVGQLGYPTEMDAVKQLGVRIVRTTMDWSQMENTTSPGVYNPKFLQHWDNWVKVAQDKGIELELLVHGNPPGVSYANKEESYRRYANFMHDMVARYPQIHYFELFNEMDTGGTDLFGANAGKSMEERGKLYGNMLKIAYPAIKSANQNAIVLVGGITQYGVKPQPKEINPDQSNFIQGIYKSGAKNYFDIMNIHTYPTDYNSSLLPLIEVYDKWGQAARDIMNQNGDQGKPLWNTEWGVDYALMQIFYNYPHIAWTSPRPESGTLDPPDTSECNWNNIEKDASGRPKYDGDGFDYQQCKEYREVLKSNSSSGIYDKTLVYQFISPSNAHCTDYNNDPNNPCPSFISRPGVVTTNLNQYLNRNYAYGIMRGYEDINKFLAGARPAYNWLKSTQVNQKINSHPSFISDINVNYQGLVPAGYQYKQNGPVLTIKNVTIDSLYPTKVILQKPIISPPVARPSVPPSAVPPPANNTTTGGSVKPKANPSAQQNNATANSPGSNKTPLSTTNNSSQTISEPVTGDRIISKPTTGGKIFTNIQMAIRKENNNAELIIRLILYFFAAEALVLIIFVIRKSFRHKRTT